MNDTALVKLDAAKHALAECKTVMEAKQIAGIAELHVFSRLRASGLISYQALNYRDSCFQRKVTPAQRAIRCCRLQLSR